MIRFKRAFTNAVAVVIATSPADLQRLPQYELMNKSYYPEFRLQGVVIGEGVAAERPVKRAPKPSPPISRYG